MGPQQHLKITVCSDAADAVAQGFNYSAEPERYKPIEIERAVVVQNGTEGGNSTVDFILKDQTGQRFVVMLTGRLLKLLPC